jgi:hypothetical protein
MSKKKWRNQDLQPSKVERGHDGYLPSQQGEDQTLRAETHEQRNPVAHTDPALYENHR